jgi:hypothetical protein
MLDDKFTACDAIDLLGTRFSNTICRTRSPAIAGARRVRGHNAQRALAKIMARE